MAERKPRKRVQMGRSRDGGHLVEWDDRCCDECYSGPWTYILAPHPGTAKEREG